ncbi:MAG: arginine deiminase family protein [Chloroflexota bacterium]
MFRNAIVRPPGVNFADGLTTVDLGAPAYERALVQHEQYCAALEQCGLTLTRLETDLRYPDSTFVEDTAIQTERCAILTRPGAPSRAGEVAAMRETLAQFYPSLQSIQAPGTLDGGDICEAGNHFFIGISERTNAEGARQLAELLARASCTSACVDIRGMKSILHLKSGIAYLGENRLVVIDDLAGREAFRGYELIRVEAGEEYAANCVRVNESVLVAAGFPAFEATVRGLGYPVIALDMSEYQKMDGGLSCLSLRF